LQFKLAAIIFDEEKEKRLFLRFFFSNRITLTRVSHAAITAPATQTIDRYRKQLQA